MTVDTSKVEYVSGPSNSNFRNGRIIYTWTDPNGGESPLTGGTIATFRLKARNAGNAGFSVSGDFYAPDESAINLNFSGVTVTVAEPSTPEPTIQVTPTNQPEPLTPTPTNSVTPTETPVETPEANEPSISTTPSVPSATNTPSNPSETTFPTSTYVPVNTPNQTTSQSPNIPSPNEYLSSNTNLKSLRLDASYITPNFSPDILQYEATVNETINNVDVLAVPEDANSNISITGNNDLQIGSNLVQVTVIAQNGDKKTYNITVYKSETANRSNSFLENLAIENVFLVPEFRYDIFDYVAEVGSMQEKINLLAVPQREGASVRIEGQENLVFGNNTITIVVTSEDGTSNNIYTIVAYRKTEQEEMQDEEGGDSNEEDVTGAENEPMSEDARKANSISNVVMATIITVGALGVIGMLIWKYRKKSE